MSHPNDTTDKALTTAPTGAIAPHGTPRAMQVAGQVANEHAARAVFADFHSRKADNTIRAYAAALARFADFLADVGIPADAEQLQTNPDAWQDMTWGLVAAFRNWLVVAGDAISTVNQRLTAVKTYCRLAAQAGALDGQEYQLIRTVSGYSRKDAKRIDDRRETTRRGDKKAQHVSLTPDQAKALKNQPDTPQGRRDAVIMTLLLDHGLRVGELAGLRVSDFDLKAGELRFYRPKVDKVQTHKLTADAARAVSAWFESGNAPAAGPLLRGSRKGGALTGAGMSERAITARVNALGAAIGIEGLSAHDCRHHWATFWAKRVDVLRLQEAGGWASLAMPRQYVEEAEIANEGMA